MGVCKGTWALRLHHLQRISETDVLKSQRKVLIYQPALQHQTREPVIWLHSTPPISENSIINSMGTLRGHVFARDRVLISVFDAVIVMPLHRSCSQFAYFPAFTISICSSAFSANERGCSRSKKRFGFIAIIHLVMNASFPSPSIDNGIPFGLRSEDRRGKRLGLSYGLSGESIFSTQDTAFRSLMVHCDIISDGCLPAWR